MVTVLEIVQLKPEKNMRLKLLADSKEDVLPTKVQDVPGLTGEGTIDRGSICITPALDMCIMRNDGTWGPWV